jgi:hypothetical protein
MRLGKRTKVTQLLESHIYLGIIFENSVFVSHRTRCTSTTKTDGLIILFREIIAVDCGNRLFIWLYSPLLDLGRFFSFLILYTVGKTPWTGDQPVARPLSTHRTTQTQNKGTQTSLPWVRFEPTIPALEGAKTVHALDCAATAIGLWESYGNIQIRTLGRIRSFLTLEQMVHIFKRLTSKTVL